jgi:outer membrane receptor protein involved in Fe transport
VVILTTSLAAAPAWALNLTQQVSFNIPPQRLSAALLEFSHEAKVQIVVGPEVGERNTDGVSGTHSISDALTTLLGGSTLVYRVINDTSIIVGRADSTLSGPRMSPAAQAEADEKEGKKDSSGSFRVAAVDQATVSRPDAVAAADSTGSAPVLEEILVTAQKRSERLQDVPVPMTLISAQTLAASNQVRLQDYYASVPGLTVAPEASSPFQLISIRGVTTGVATNPTVGITVDDVPYGSSTNLGGGPAVPDFDPSDLAQLEVLRGPQGTLYGASSMGGLLKFVTVDPSTAAVSGRVEAGVSSVYKGDEPGYNVRGSANVPLSDSLAVRASGFTRQDPGYIENVQTGQRGINEGQVSGGRLSALWKPSEALSLNLSALFQESRGDGASDVDVQPGLGDLQQSYLKGTGGYDRKVQAYSAIVSAKIGDVDITSVSGYNVNSFSDSFDYTYGFDTYTQDQFGVTGTPARINSRTNKFTQELRFSVPLGPKVEWLLGGFYTHEGSQYVENILAANSDTGAIVGFWGAFAQPTTYSEYAAFTDVTLHVTDRLDIQIGGRESEIRQTSAETDSGPYVPSFELVPSPHVFQQVATNENAFTYLVTPQLRISPNLMLYARLASGYRAGGANFNPGGVVPAQFDPDKTQNYEIGLKGDFADHRLLVDASVYYIDWKDIQLSLTNPQTFAGYNANAGRAKSQGVELSTVSKPMQDLTLSAWVTFSDARLTGDFPADSPSVGMSGDRLPYGSRFSANVSLKKDFPLGPRVTGFASGMVSYVGERLGEFPSVYATPPERQVYPGYAKTDLLAGARYELWTVNFFINNATDNRGLLSGGQGAFPPFAFNFIQPRTVGLSLTRTF